MNTKLLGQLMGMLLSPIYPIILSLWGMRSFDDKKYISRYLKEKAGKKGKNPIIAVLTSDFHNTGIAVGTIVNNKAFIVCNNEEERFGVREKYTREFPENAIQSVIHDFQIKGEDIDLFGLSWDAVKVLRYGTDVLLNNLPQSLTLLKKEASPNAAMSYVFNWRVLNRKIAASFRLSTPPPIICIEHHRNHAASFYLSPFENALVWVADAYGDSQSISVWRGEGKTLKKVYQNDFFDSLGLLYSLITKHCGFPTVSGEGKLMGLAAFGNPDKFYSLFKRIVQFTPGHGISFDWSLANWKRKGEIMPFTARFYQIAGPPVAPGTPFSFSPMDECTEYRANMAAALQKRVTEITVEMIEYFMEKEGQTNLVMSGGFSLNCPTNQKIIEEGKWNLFIPPNPSDTGTDVGGVLNLLIDVFGADRPDPMETSYYCGKEYSVAEMEQAIVESSLHYRKLNSLEEAAYFAAEQIKNDKIIAWFQGRAETGPRALGNRSILANPGNPNIREIINTKVKLREVYRPLCPSVLEEHFHTWFCAGSAKRSPFMTTTFQIRDEYRDRVISTVHEDNTCRVQTVHRSQNETYYKLIERFYQLTGLPMVLNTSFNINEPIVQTPKDAVKTFKKSSMDFLVMGPFIVTHEKR